MTQLERINKAIDLLKEKEVIYNQMSIATKLEYNKSTISEMLNGKIPLSEKFVYIFCRKFGVRYEYVNTGTLPIMEVETKLGDEPLSRDLIIRLFNQYEERINDLKKREEEFEKSVKILEDLAAKVENLLLAYHE